MMALALNLLSMMGLAGLGTAFAALSGLILGAILAIYVYTAIALMTIAKKDRHKNGMACLDPYS